MNVKPNATESRAAQARGTRVRGTRLRVLGIVLGSLALCIFLSVATISVIRYRRLAQAQRWYRPSSEAPADLDWQELDPARVHRVVKDKQPEAIKMLEEVAVVELAAEQATEYVGEPLPEAPGARPYLVRSLVKFLPGVYSVRVADGHLDVSHRSLGRGPVQMSRHAVVLQLDRKPDEVYTGTSAAQ
jgi:hypothetical protein